MEITHFGDAAYFNVCRAFEEKSEILRNDALIYAIEKGDDKETLAKAIGISVSAHLWQALTACFGGDSGMTQGLVTNVANLAAAELKNEKLSGIPITIILDASFLNVLRHHLLSELREFIYRIRPSLILRSLSGISGAVSIKAVPTASFFRTYVRNLRDGSQGFVYPPGLSSIHAVLISSYSPKLTSISESIVASAFEEAETFAATYANVRYSTSGYNSERLSSQFIGTQSFTVFRHHIVQAAESRLSRVA